MTWNGNFFLDGLSSLGEHQAYFTNTSSDKWPNSKYDIRNDGSPFLRKSIQLKNQPTYTTKFYIKESTYQNPIHFLPYEGSNSPFHSNMYHHGNLVYYITNVLLLIKFVNGSEIMITRGIHKIDTITGYNGFYIDQYRRRILGRSWL